MTKIPPAFEQAIRDALPCECGNFALVGSHNRRCRAYCILTVIATLTPLWQSELAAAEEAGYVEGYKRGYHKEAAGTGLKSRGALARHDAELVAASEEAVKRECHELRRKDAEMFKLKNQHITARSDYMEKAILEGALMKPPAPIIVQRDLRHDAELKRQARREALEEAANLFTAEAVFTGLTAQCAIRRLLDQPSAPGEEKS